MSLLNLNRLLNHRAWCRRPAPLDFSPEMSGLNLLKSTQIHALIDIDKNSNLNTIQHPNEEIIGRVCLCVTLRDAPINTQNTMYKFDLVRSFSN